MYITDAVGNISERFMCSKINIIYRPNNNLFDYSISLLPYDIYCIINNNDYHDINNIKYIQPQTFPNRQYNIEINSSILDFSNQKKTNAMLGLNTISFCHYERLPMIKKEDLFLLKDNLKECNKVFFSKHAVKSWQFDSKTYLMPYGVPKSLIKKEKEKNNEVLIFNLDNKNLSAIESILSSQNISYYTATKINEDLLNRLNSCKICLDMNDSNVINVLYGIACGAIGVIPKTHMIQEDFAHVNNLRSFSDISSMMNIIKQGLLDNPIEDNIEEEFAYSSFEQAIGLLIQQINKEVVVL